MGVGLDRAIKIIVDGNFGEEPGRQQVLLGLRELGGLGKGLLKQLRHAFAPLPHIVMCRSISTTQASLALGNSQSTMRRSTQRTPPSPSSPRKPRCPPWS